MNNFFITGLPRSRTSWLANLFTYKDSYCFHELAKHGGNVYDLVAKLKSREETYVGTSDCSFGFYHRDILELLPNSKIVVVMRNSDDVKDSLMKFANGWSGELEVSFQKNKKYVADVIKSCDPLIIDYSDLNNESIVKEIWSYLLPEIKWDDDRWDQLEETKVEIIKEKWLPKVDVQRLNELLGV